MGVGVESRMGLRIVLVSFQVFKCSPQPLKAGIVVLGCKMDQIFLRAPLVLMERQTPLAPMDA